MKARARTIQAMKNNFGFNKAFYFLTLQSPSLLMSFDSSSRQFFSRFLKFF